MIKTAEMIAGAKFANQCHFVLTHLSIITLFNSKVPNKAKRTVTTRNIVTRVAIKIQTNFFL